ncbi:transcriptional regulator [Dysgonomonas sp. 521]|uniref:winged helix-turn-helix transcriptional regulator n=1 Tax=Dysgonomonas sp. 521 TaxID=2302932 RepID=UPI0013D8CDF9|nr:helix-turn-helix domain-containing protein [Dysgonomonas sp. 521]NDV93790.1 transcriptional regulator [Dysgonomonas sp. 521]
MKTFLRIEACPIRDIISRLGDKWSLLVLATLDVNGTMRFNDIYKSIGDISQRMLTVTLRSLESDGLISRKIYPEVPPRVEYTLTESGKELMPYLNNLVDWAMKNMENIVDNRGQYEGKKENKIL